MIYVEPALLASGPPTTPRVGAYRPTPASFTASSSALGFDATFASSPYTDTAWKATAAPAVLTETFVSPSEVGYFGMAGTNLGSSGTTVTVSTLIGAVWSVRMVFTPTDNSPVFGLLVPTVVSGIRYSLSTVATVSHVRAGRLITFPRDAVYVGSQSFDDGITDEFRRNVSQTGKLLRTYVIRQGQQAKMKVNNISEAWHLSNLKALRGEVGRVPAFFADRPLSYPRSVLYGVSTSKASIERSTPNRLNSISVEFNLEGDVSGP